MEIKNKLAILVFIIILSIAVVFPASNICNQGCEKNLEECSNEAPYLCKRAWWPDKCVVPGYDFKACGEPEEGKGYCYECDQGCVFGDGCSGDTPYKCKKSWAFDKCVPEGYDFGCCGGLSGEKDIVTVLTVTLINNGPPCSSNLEWKVKRRGEVDWIDYSDECYEGNYEETELSLNSDESITLTCRSKFIPHYDTGPHKARISWCGNTWEFEYGEHPKSEKYCVINVTRNGDNENELDIDAIVYTIGELLTKIRNGERGSATISPYDPVFPVGRLNPIVPVNDIKPARECKAECPECSVVFNFTDDITGRNKKEEELCKGEAFLEGYACTGAIYLLATSRFGNGLRTTGGELEVHETLKRETDCEVVKELGDELYGKAYIGERAAEKVENDLRNLLRTKYRDINFPDLYFKLEDKEKISKMIVEKIKRDPEFNDIKNEFIKALEAKKIEPKRAERIVDEFFRSGNIIRGMGLNVPTNNKIAETLIYDVRMFRYNNERVTFADFIERVIRPSRTLPRQNIRTKIMEFEGVSSGYYNFYSKTIMFENCYYISDLIEVGSHEFGHPHSYNSYNFLPGEYLPDDKSILTVIEMAGIETQSRVLNELDRIYPDSGYDIIYKWNRYYDLNYIYRKYKMGRLRDGGEYVTARAILDYYKDEKGIDNFVERYSDDLAAITRSRVEEKALLKFTGRLMEILGDLANAMRNGGRTLMNLLNFDEESKVYVLVGKGLEGTKTAAKVIGRVAKFGIAKVLLLDDKLGGMWALYESSKNPITQNLVGIDYITRDGERGTGCGTMIITGKGSEDEGREYYIPESFTLKKGYIWEIHLGSHEGELIHEGICKELGLAGIGVDVKPQYMECTKEDKYVRCKEIQRDLEISGEEELFPTDAGYICSDAVEAEGKCGS